MIDKAKRGKEDYPKRKPAVLRYEVDEKCVEIPVEISCRSDGDCVIRNPKMEELIFQKAGKDVEKTKREVKK